MIRTYCVRLLLLGLLFVWAPFFSVFAAVNPSPSPEKPKEDACETGEKSVSGKGDSVSGGGKDTVNTIWVDKGKITVKCRPTKLGEKPYVVYCGLDGECAVFDKGTPQSEKLMKLYDEARSQGVPKGPGRYESHPQDVVNNMLSGSLKERAQNIIGKEGGSGLQSYSDIFDTMGSLSTETEPRFMSFDPVADAVEMREALVKTYVPPPQQPTPPLESTYPNSFDLSYDPSQATDAYAFPGEQERYTQRLLQKAKSLMQPTQQALPPAGYIQTPQPQLHNFFQSLKPVMPVSPPRSFSPPQYDPLSFSTPQRVAPSTPVNPPPPTLQSSRGTFWFSQPVQTFRNWFRGLF